MCPSTPFARRTRFNLSSIRGFVIGVFSKILWVGWTGGVILSSYELYRRVCFPGVASRCSESPVNKIAVLKKISICSIYLMFLRSSNFVIYSIFALENQFIVQFDVNNNDLFVCLLIDYCLKWSFLSIQYGNGSF